MENLYIELPAIQKPADYGRLRMTDDTEPTKEVYGPVIPPEEHERRRERYYDMARRQIVLDAAKKRDKLPPSEPDIDLITPERKRHAMGEDGKTLLTEITLDESIHWKAIRLDDAPLGRLLFRKKPLIEPYQFHCGERYYKTAYYAGLLPAGTIDPAAIRVDGGSYKDISDRKIAAMTKHEHTIRKLTFEDVSILDAIVLQEISVAEYAERFVRVRERRVRQAITIDRITVALDHLDRLYYPQRTDIGMSSYHQADFRPSDRLDLRERV